MLLFHHNVGTVGLAAITVALKGNVNLVVAEFFVFPY